MSGRLPSLKDTGKSEGKPSLKFRPKVVARRSREAREASEPRLTAENEKKQKNGAGNGGDRDKKREGSHGSANTNQQRRMARFLSNTHVISAGPLSAANATATRSANSGATFGNQSQGFMKTESGSELVQRGLQDLTDNDVSDDEKLSSRFNMGREVGAEDDVRPTDYLHPGDVEDESVIETDQQILQQLFPVRPLRIRHEDIDAVHKKLQSPLPNNLQTITTPMVKEEDSDQDPQSILENRSKELETKLDHLKLQDEASDEFEAEKLALKEDHIQIERLLRRLDNQRGRFAMLQLPPDLPQLQISDSEKGSEKLNASEIGTLRFHKSGRVSVMIDGIEMDIKRGAQTSFIQDVILRDDQSRESENNQPEFLLQRLGSIDTKLIITPSISNSYQ